MEILRRTPWSRIREQNSVYKEFLETVGNGKPTGGVLKETIAVSATIWISVEILHHQIRLRILSCSRMSENHRESEVPVAECLDGLARITLEELAITHFVKNGTLQNACSARPTVLVGWGKVLIRTSSGWWTADKKVSQEWWQKCCDYVEKGKLARKRMNVPIDRGNLGREAIRNWNKIHLNVNLLMHGSWVAFFRTWRCWSQFSGRAPACRSRSNVWNSQRLWTSHQNSRPKSFARIYSRNFMSVAPTPQNLRIGLRRRQSGKSKVPTKQRGSWPKVCWNFRSMKEQHSSHLRKMGGCLHERWNLRKENLLSTLERQCTWSAKKDLSNAEMDTLTKLCSPKTITTANGEVQTHEEAIVYVKELDIFLTLKVLDNTPAVLSLGKLCDENECSFEWISGQKPHLSKKVFEHNGTRKTSFLSWFQACQVLPLHLHQLYGHLRNGRLSSQFFSWSFFRASLQRDVRIW